MEFIVNAFTFLQANGPLILLWIFCGAFFTSSLYDKSTPKWGNVIWWGIIAGGVVAVPMWFVLSTLLGAVGIPL